MFPILVKVTHFECWEKCTLKKPFPVQTRAGVALRHHNQCQVIPVFFFFSSSFPLCRRSRMEVSKGCFGTMELGHKSSLKHTQLAGTNRTNTVWSFFFLDSFVSLQFTNSPQMWRIIRTIVRYGLLSFVSVSFLSSPRCGRMSGSARSLRRRQLHQHGRLLWVQMSRWPPSERDEPQVWRWALRNEQLFSSRKKKTQWTPSKLY